MIAGQSADSSTLKSDYLTKKEKWKIYFIAEFLIAMNSEDPFIGFFGIRALLTRIHFSRFLLCSLDTKFLVTLFTFCKELFMNGNDI